MPYRHFLLLIIAALSTASMRAQDVPAVDPNQLLQALRALKDQQAQLTKSAKQKALQQVQAAAATPAAAVTAWEEAVRAVQFDGAPREGSQFKEWREREGDALKEKEAAGAAQLHFKWMALTLQRSMGTPLKELLPAIVTFTKEVAADQAAMETLAQEIDHEKDAPVGNKRAKDRRRNDEQVKRVHDQILRSPVNGSVAAQALKITTLLEVDSWEYSAGNTDGIFKNIVLPELRAARDPRVLEYWDMKLKREADTAAKSKLAFETEKFNQVRRPEILWNRAQDVLLLGQRNRAISEMFNLIKTYPAHPNASAWMTTLEETLVPGQARAVKGAETPSPAPPPE
jgi:hypothetical protein